jgi:hypothetical protein
MESTISIIAKSPKGKFECLNLKPSTTFADLLVQFVRNSG